MGSVLTVPFGNRRMLGVVVEVAEESDLPPERLAEPLSALEADVPPELVRLGLWVAQEYVSTPARGLSLVLPPGTGTGAAQAHGGAPVARARRSPPPGRAALERRSSGWARASAPRWRRWPPGPRGSSDLAARRLRPRRRAPARGARAGRARRRPRRRRARPEVRAVGARGPTARSSTDAQARVLGEVVGRMDAPGAGRRLLLHGVTGSGKTEVYLRAVAAALERGPLGDRAGARDRADAADRGPLRRALRRHRGDPALAADRARALRRVGAAAPRRRARVRGPALGGLRAADRRRADRGRRGARRLLQAGGRPALRRPPRGRAPRRGGGRRAAGRQRHAAARERAALRAAASCPSAWTAGRCRRSRWWAWPGCRARCTRARATRWRRCGAPEEKAIVLLNRRGWSNFLTCRDVRPGVGVPALRRDAGAAPRGRAGVLPPLRPLRAGAGRLPGLRVGHAARATGWAPSSWARSWSG